jgi:hypothetical protein
MYSLLLVFPHSIRGSLHITHTCICIGLWPPVNDSCHSQHGIRALGFAPARRNFVRFLAAEDHPDVAIFPHRITAALRDS